MPQGLRVDDGYWEVDVVRIKRRLCQIRRYKMLYSLHDLHVAWLQEFYGSTNEWKQWICWWASTQHFAESPDHHLFGLARGVRHGHLALRQLLMSNRSMGRCQFHQSWQRWWRMSSWYGKTNAMFTIPKTTHFYGWYVYHPQIPKW